MKTETAVASGWDDLIFENRNKEYGAYDLRKSYSGNATSAMMICMLAAAGILLLSSFSFTKEKIEEPVDDDGIFTITTMPPIKPLQPKQQQRVIPPPSREVRDVPPVITTKAVPDQPEITTEPVEPTVDGTGEPNAGIDEYAEGTDEGVAEPVMVISEPSVVDLAEVMPSYIGGLGEMAKDLRENIHYPLRAKRQEVEGTVFVGFVVNSHGRVVDVKIIRGINEDCDKEAVRVISAMSKWKAGTQKGIPVSVRMVLPVKFKLNSI